MHRQPADRHGPRSARLIGARDLSGALRLLRLMAAFGLLIVLGLRLTGMLDPDLAHADLLVLFLVWLVTKWVTRLRISP